MAFLFRRLSKFFYNHNASYVKCEFKYQPSGKSPISVYFLRLRSTMISKSFKILDGSVDKGSQKFQANLASYQLTRAKYAEIFKIATGGGSAKDKERHVQRNKKMLVEDRLKLLFDSNEDILEIAPLAGMHMPYGDVPRAAIVAAIGKINGIYCMVLANDATVKAGTMYPISVKKQLRVEHIALQNRLPCIFVVDSGGAFLPLQADIFPDKNHGGQVFYNEAIMNSLSNPVVAVVCGSCTAGAAYVPTMAQEAVIVDQIGTIFLAGPPLVKAALGEVISSEDLGGGLMHSSVSGCTDYFARTEKEAFELTRDIVAAMNIPDSSSRDHSAELVVDKPLYDAEDIPGLIPADQSQITEVRKILARIVDGSRFHEFKAEYGKELITGFAFITGRLVGIICQNVDAMSPAASQKGSHFVQLCSQRNVPLIFFQNSATSQGSARTHGEHDGLLIRANAQLMASVACSRVPKITIIIGNSFGDDNFLLAGRSFDPNFLFAWPNARIAIIDDSSYSDLLTQLYKTEMDEKTKVAASSMNQCQEQFAVESTAVFASSNLWDDGVILPQDTRKVLAQCLRIFKQNDRIVTNQGPRKSNDELFLRM